jgi:hypothetical protein
MAGLSEDRRNRIISVLDATDYKLRGFALKYDDTKNPVVIITFSSRPECRFVISTTDPGVFATSESPGIHSDEAETFQRSNFELCMNAIKEWVERIIERDRDWMLDEFGGVADRNPSL